MAARWKSAETEIIKQKIDETSTTQNHPLGKVIKGEYTGYASGAANYGAGEFIYLAGVANTVVGSVVVYDPLDGSTTLVPNTAKRGDAVAVAMAATDAGEYGWYQVSGAAVMKKTAVAVAPGVAIYISATAGRVMPTLASGKQILGARTANDATVAAGTSTVTVVINRPALQGEAGAA
jgi:predicted RecA/RadA family phage recombinase